MDRNQILNSIHEAYRVGRPADRVLRERMAVLRSGADPEGLRLMPSDGELGRAVYRKRKSGKVASFFRCLLR